MSTSWQQEAGMSSGDDLENIQGYTEQALQAKIDAEAAEAEAQASAVLANDAKVLAQASQVAASSSAQEASISASSITGSVTAAQAAQAAAESAQELAEQAYDDTVTSRNEASGFATSASGSAGDALTYRGQALTYKDQAETAKDTAVSAANSTAGSVTQANDAKVAAETAQGLAESAQGAAESARAGAESAQTAAESAAGSVTALAAQASDDANSASGSAEAADLSAQAASESEDNANTSYQNTVQTYQDTLGIYGSISAVEQAVDQAQTAVTDATSQVSLAAAEKVGAQTARDTAESFKDQAYTYSQSAASAVAYQDLTAIAQTKSESAVDVFVYDTSKDSDGGAWRKRTQGTSWYNEPLNTSTRGSRKEFPAVAVIVAEAGKTVIYDGDDPSLPMWMVFNTGVNNGYRFIITGSITSVACKNGLISIGRLSIVAIDFIGDRAQYIANTTQGDYSGHNISQRNEYGDIQNDVNWLSDSYIINGTVNDVAMTVLPDAPIDPATGLPIPTIAVATDGGVSVIKDDGNVFDITFSGGWGSVIKALSITKDTLYFRQSNYTWAKVGLYDIDQDFNLGAYLFTANHPFYPLGKPHDYHSKSLGLGLDSDKYELVTRLDNLPSSNYSGLGLHVTEGTNDPYMNCFIGSDCNTGWMNGDIKLATLSDTDDTDLVGSELITNGTFDTDTSGWTIGGEGASFAVVNGELVITRNGTSAVASQTIATEVGKTYVLTCDLTATTNNAEIGLQLGFSTIERGNTLKTYSVTHVATSTSTTVYIKTYNTASGTLTIDNISVRLAEPDRSVNNNGLQVFGTVQKSPVATGADLVAYGPFSASNYLQQPYNSDLDFGTGDFCVMGWVKYSGADGGILDRGNGLNSNQRLQVHVFTNNVFRVHLSGQVIATPSGSLPQNVWNIFTLVREGGIGYLYINGKLEASGALVNSITSSDMTSYIGVSHMHEAPLNGSLALLRISGTAPTAEQIAKIYRDEKVLFQEGAQATLHGTSDAVTALAYDEGTDLLHVGTSSGRSDFKGLRRINNTTDAVGTALSASNGLIVEE